MTDEYFDDKQVFARLMWSKQRDERIAEWGVEDRGGVGVWSIAFRQLTARQVQAILDIVEK